MPGNPVDSALARALRLDPAVTTSGSGGSSGFANLLKLSSTLDGRPVHYFVKTNSGENAQVMFQGEFASLEAIRGVVPNFCPNPHAHGPLESPRGGTFFLATDFLDLSAPGPAGSGLSLAAKLAKLHTTPAPPPPGRSPQQQPMFGFPVPTCCGPTVQDNTWTASWPEFFAERRLRAVLDLARGTRGRHPQLERAVERTIAEVVPRLLGEETLGSQVVPVVVHGDLWSGNRGRAVIGGEGGVEEVVYDAAAVYGHSEYELGIMRMFDGFGPAFWKEYCRLVPRAEPAEEWDDRVDLYMLYHQMNHYAIFGSSYRTSAIGIMEKLIAKYGSKKEAEAGE